MSACGYGFTTGAAVALVSATAKCVMGVKAHANSGIQVVNFEIGFDGVTASAVPVVVELCYATFATNSPGTASTSATIQQQYGRVLTAGFTAAYAWTTEPTVLTVLKKWPQPADKGLVMYQFVLGKEPDSALAEGYVVRCTAPAAVNAHGGMLVERI